MQKQLEDDNKVKEAQYTTAIKELQKSLQDDQTQM